MMFYSIAKILVKSIITTLFRIDVQGEENIPKTGPCILCINHKSVLDPPLIGVFIPRKLNFMAKEELFRIPILKEIIKAFGAFPVKRATADISAIKTALNLLKEGRILAIYPEGTRNKSDDLIQAKSGMTFIAIKAQVPIIPIGISGKYRLFHKIHINIGEPIYLTEYYNQKLPMNKLQPISDLIMERIRELMEVK